MLKTLLVHLEMNISKGFNLCERCLTPLVRAVLLLVPARVFVDGCGDDFRNGRRGRHVAIYAGFIVR